MFQRSRQGLNLLGNALLKQRQSAPMGARFVSIEIVKARMESVKNIKKITSAMKMVAAAKLRKVQVETMLSRGMVQPWSRLMSDVANVKTEKSVLLPITSDRGLCGGINSIITKYTKTIHEQLCNDESDNRVSILGDKGKAQMARSLADKIDFVAQDYGKVAITFALASEISEELIKNTNNPGAIRILFSKFVNSITYKPCVSTVLSSESLAKVTEDGSWDKYEIEGPEKHEILQDLTEFQLTSTLYNGMMESYCSEYASRMAAMESSTKNASEMIDSLTLLYNRTRQAAITTELIEIISGAAALEDSS